MNKREREEMSNDVSARLTQFHTLDLVKRGLFTRLFSNPQLAALQSALEAVECGDKPQKSSPSKGT